MSKVIFRLQDEQNKGFFHGNAHFPSQSRFVCEELVRLNAVISKIKKNSNLKFNIENESF